MFKEQRQSFNFIFIPGFLCFCTQSFFIYGIIF